MAAGEGSGKGKGGGLGCVLCVSVLFALVLAVGGLIGLCLAIWQIVDALHLNDELMSLAKEVVGDDRLLTAIYIMLAFTIVSICFGGIGGKAKKDEDEDNKGTSICGGLLSLALLGGYLAAGIIALNYRNDALPKLREGMQEGLREKSYINPESPITAPEYTKFGEYFNFLQCKYKCCGVTLPYGGDYIAANFPARYNLTVPYSCCKLKANRKVEWREVALDDVEDYEKCSKFEGESFHRYTCYDTEYYWLEFKANFLMGYNFLMAFLGVGSGVLLFLLLCCACCCV